MWLKICLLYKRCSRLPRCCETPPDTFRDDKVGKRPVLHLNRTSQGRNPRNRPRWCCLFPRGMCPLDILNRRMPRSPPSKSPTSTRRIWIQRCCLPWPRTFPSHIPSTRRTRRPLRSNTCLPHTPRNLQNQCCRFQCCISLRRNRSSRWLREDVNTFQPRTGHSLTLHFVLRDPNTCPCRSRRSWLRW